MRTIYKRILIGLASLVCLVVFAFVALIVYAMLPPLRSFSRTDEKLPTVSIEAGSTVYCRMRYCDFRFPLPSNVHVVWTNIDDGGFDTIHGAVFIIGTNGSPVLPGGLGLG